jgi:hypothetical protein
MTLLLYIMAFGWMLALFASLIGLIGWILIKLCRWLTEPPEPTKQTPRNREGWNPNHLKRAGQ